MRFGVKCGPELSQNEVSQNLRKINPFKFSDYLYQVTLAYRLKIEVNDFFGEKYLVLRCLFGPKEAQNEFFQGIIKNQCMGLFLFLA